jgi:phosphatidylglycerol:prolipoprotein diacylglycerol transferase
MLAVWLHQLDPFAFGPIRWYGLAYLVGFALAYGLLRLIVHRGRSPLNAHQAGDLVVTLALAVVIGGRLGHVFLYQPRLLTDVSASFPLWGVLAIHEGGMASHGGMIGGVIGCGYFAYRHSLPPLFLGDLFAFGAPAGLALGRLANFVNGELIGRPVRETFPLAVKFPQEIYAWSAGRRAELYDQLPSPEIALIDQSRWTAPAVVQQVQAGHEKVIEAIAPLLTPRHPWQLYAALAEGLLILLVLLAFYQKPRKPGSVGFLFLILYGLARLVDEFWRAPATSGGIDFTLAGLELTRGQWLSAALGILGIIGLYWTTRRNVKPLGGWLHK